MLLTTYTRALARALERDLALMLDARHRASVQVGTVDSWANGIVRETHGLRRLAVLDERSADERWRAAAADVGVDATPAFLGAEWVHVVQAQGIDDEEGYLACRRHGRGRALGAAARRGVWRAVETFAGGLRADGLWTWTTIADEAARILTASGPRFEHVVVDESQDLHLAHWRLLRAAVKTEPEDLFLAGDPHQRIYGHRVSLASLGISVRGRRSATLTLSYRTSAEILRWALSVRDGHTESGLDGQAGDLTAYRSAFSGVPPEVVGAATRDEELAGLVDAVRAWRHLGLAWEDIAVVGRSRWVWGSAATALRNADIPVVDLSKAEGQDAVRMGSMHGLKGLEFRAVAVVGVCEGIVPRPGITPETDDEVLRRHELADERNPLFVAATRPREHLRVSWHGTPSPFLPEGRE